MTNTFQRPALDVLAELRRGKVQADLTQRMHDLIAACIDTGKKGELVLKLTFEPDADDSSRMKVTDQIASKLPSRTVKPSLFFLTQTGNLTRTDPSQETFEGLKAIENDSTEEAPNQSQKAN